MGMFLHKLLCSHFITVWWSCIGWMKPGSTGPSTGSMRTWCRPQHARLQAWCQDLRFGRVPGWEWICFTCDSILITVSRKLEFVALGVHASLYLCSLVTFSHFKSGLDYGTCFCQWEKIWHQQRFEEDLMCFCIFFVDPWHCHFEHAWQSLPEGRRSIFTQIRSREEPSCSIGTYSRSNHPSQLANQLHMPERAQPKGAEPGTDQQNASAHLQTHET